jgi:vesicle coat complex subunit
MWHAYESHGVLALAGLDLTDTLYDMLRDRDPQVVVNTIHALNEIFAHKGGMLITK